MKKLLIACIVALSFSTAQASTIAGEAYIIDGDTIDIGGERIRLEGIDAPEMGQDCNGHSMGLAAKVYLLNMTEGREVSCELSRTDKYGCALGTCYVGDIDINGTMVRAGMAYAYRRYSLAYVSEEEQARRNDLGVWAYECERPWIWRKR